MVVIAGDLCPDISSRYTGHDSNLAATYQTEWLRNDYRKWETTVDAEEIVMTPGNHDWITRMADECRTRFFVDEEWSYKGKRFYFTPWVSPCGDWNYTLQRGERKQRFSMIPKGLDVLVSHSPALGYGDQSYGVILSKDGKPPEPNTCGCVELKMAIHNQQPRNVVFGHIHEGQRYGKQYQCGGSTLYNVAMWGPNWTPTVFFC